MKCHCLMYPRIPKYCQQHGYFESSVPLMEPSRNLKLDNAPVVIFRSVMKMLMVPSSPSRLFDSFLLPLSYLDGTLVWSISPMLLYNLHSRRHLSTFMSHVDSVPTTICHIVNAYGWSDQSQTQFWSVRSRPINFDWLDITKVPCHGCKFVPTIYWFYNKICSHLQQFPTVPAQNYLNIQKNCHSRKNLKSSIPTNQLHSKSL